MARQVYLDPFGSYTNGYDKGINRQMELETNRRQARAQDFDYNQMLPFRYNTAQRDDEVGAYGLGARKQLIDYGLDNVRLANGMTQLNTAAEYGRALGLGPAPAISAAQRMWGYTPMYNPQGGFRFLDNAGNEVGGSDQLQTQWGEYNQRPWYTQDREFQRGVANDESNSQYRNTALAQSGGIAAAGIDAGNANRQQQADLYRYGYMGNAPAAATQGWEGLYNMPPNMGGWTPGAGIAPQQPQQAPQQPQMPPSLQWLAPPPKGG